jgi:hypothetical protein
MARGLHGFESNAADAGGAVSESNEADNELTAACPSLGTNSAR